MEGVCEGVNRKQKSQNEKEVREKKYSSQRKDLGHRLGSGGRRPVWLESRGERGIWFRSVGKGQSKLHGTMGGHERFH